MSKTAAKPRKRDAWTKVALPHNTYGLFEKESDAFVKSGELAAEFLLPPFTVLNAREGAWQDRKRAWIKLGIRGELGRGDNHLGFSAAAKAKGYANNADGTPKRKANGKAAGDAFTCGGPGGLGGRYKRAMAPGGGGYGPGSAYLGASGKPLGGPTAVNSKANGNTFRPGLLAASKELKGKQAGNWLTGAALADRDFYRHKEGTRIKQSANLRAGAGAAFNTTIGPYDGRGDGAAADTGTSIFDPVLCELMYKWFAPPGGHILDPFAGEATKGIVAAYLGYKYTGIELRPEQVAVNNMQAEQIGVTPTWVCGDSAELDKLLPPKPRYDFIWTSPPYYDLEIYSEKEKDGSAFETYAKFMTWYRRIFKAAVGRLRPNRFCAVKVGEIRDKKTGAYRNFVGDNIKCFLDCGLTYYNEAVLITAAGSLPIRAGKQFRGNRKLGKSHQNLLIFYKGDPRDIKEHFPC